jgi:hypothetical protein
VETLTLRRSFLVLLTTAGLAFAQSEPTTPAKPADPAPLIAPATLRVHVIGASVSGGFRDGPLTGATETGDTVTMHHLVKAWCGEHARVTAHPELAMLGMFQNPTGIGEQQVQGTLKLKADAVVAIDFPFWFAYGAVRGDELEARSARFAKGLALLARIEAPVLVGDLPDMQGAARRMMRPEWIPSPDVLKQLDAQLARFAAEHPNVRIVPLAAMVQRMKTEGLELPLAGGPVATLPGALLQGDKLHANRLGMALLGFTIQDALRAMFPEGHALRAQQWPLDRFVAACGAEDELEACKAAAKAAAKPATAPAGSGK